MSTVSDVIQKVSVRSQEDVRPAAIALHAECTARLPGWWFIPTANIASKAPMVAADGDVLALSVFGFSEEIEQGWEDSRIALHSPVHRACRYESEPFWANESGFHTAQHNPYLDDIDTNNFVKRAQCSAAVAIPIHLPFGVIGALLFGPLDQEKTDLSKEFAAHADELSVYAHRMIAGYQKVTRKRQWLPADCQLTKREVECLRWASIGKTDKEISMILSRSHATVRFHIQNAGEKLDAVNRSQTIFKAGQLGYLGLAA
ncbi:autoinducer binding domain-containing protein [Pacificimonas sp. WHA3]|uniref:Autoinducer binding domain-containing protein n=1 Tax=Pacificimonas pallii TaxID=2827236 RepID=A0ABS6SE86_9SPHN|nr:LuxR family transcriptional regulator [Pacificimonas pallii]MBV7256699.1 autoinducer binding domain-containing protein [Pacificimonas pallii]